MPHYYFYEGTSACQVYSLNRKIVYAAWARNFSAVKPFLDVWLFVNR